MGYTHYWTSKKKKLNNKAIELLTSILNDGYQKGILQYDYNSAESPCINNDYVRFNGIGVDGHETFLWTPNNKQEFCKTARKDYDKYVTATLLIISYYTRMSLESDGDGEEWIDGMKLILKHEPIEDDLKNSIEAMINDPQILFNKTNDES